MSGESRRVFIFVPLVLGLSALVSSAVPVIGEASLWITMFTPAIAMALMLAFFAPERGFRAAIDSLGLATVGLKGFPLAIGTPVVIFFGGTMILVAFGLTEISTDVDGRDLPRIMFKFAVGLVISTLLAMCEEVGWRGYFLPRIMGVGAVRAMLLVGFIQGIWHMPLLLTTDYYHQSTNPWIAAPLFLTTLTLAGVFFGYLRIRTSSVWPVAVAHAATNSAWGIAANVSQTKSPLVLEYVGGESGIVMICGLLIIDLLLIRKMRSLSALNVRT